MIEAANALSNIIGSQKDANNGTSGCATGLGEDPMSQIAQILSSHLDSLQWIDWLVRELESDVTEVEKRVREAGLSVNGGGSERWTWEVDEIDSRVRTSVTLLVTV